MIKISLKKRKIELQPVHIDHSYYFYEDEGKHQQLYVPI